jgi:hypothetical protein
MAPDFSKAGHLPKQRPDGQLADPYELPRQRNGVTPQMHGRYPDYNVLDNADHWDPVTRKVVMQRLQPTPPIRFFTRDEAETLGVFCDLVMAQDSEPKIPVLAMVDAKLFAGQLDGFIYADMPDDRETWRLVARGLDAAARQHGAASFCHASEDVRHEIVEAFSTGSLHGEVWDDLPPSTAWSVVMRAVLSAFYSHPWSWNEIGFGGPAYPRGYARLGAGQREGWEGAPALSPDPVKDTSAQGES